MVESSEFIGDGHENYVADVVFCVAGMLLVGIVTRSLLQRVPIPYTVWLLLWGLVAGMLEETLSVNGSGWAPLNHGLQAVSSLNPHGLLLIFMPILIYGSAQSMDWHILRVEFCQIVIMATSGVVVAMLLTAVCIYYIFPWGWSWWQCFMFGALISATDPVAVVALLKEVGASARLGTIIEGESLLNDGSAFVLFLIFKEYVTFHSCCVEPAMDSHTSMGIDPSIITEGCEAHRTDTMSGGDMCQSFTPGDAAKLFVQLSVGGPLAGLAFGLLMVLWLMYTYNDEVIEIFITFTGTYITFYISEEILSVSGVLSIVALGFFMSAFGRSHVSPRVLHPMETVWHILEFGANTVIFILAGVIISEEIVPLVRDPRFDSSAVALWIGYGVLLYIICLVVRFITIFVHFPILSRLGYGLTWQQAIVISWSGLRGAIGLALALLVNLDVALRPEFRYQVLVLTSVVVVLTLVINGSTTKMILKALGILKPMAVKVEFLVNSINEMEEYADKHCAHLKTDPLIGDPDWERVKELSHIDIRNLVDARELEKHCAVADEEAENAKDDDASLKAVKIDIDFGADDTVGIMTSLQCDGAYADDQTSRTGMGQMKKTGDFSQSTKAQVATKATLGRSARSAAVLLNSNKERPSSCMAKRNLKQADIIRDIRARLLHGIKAVYGDGFHKNYISPNQLLELQASVDRSLDKLDSSLKDWDNLEPAVALSKLASWTGTEQASGLLCCAPCMDGIGQKFLFRELEHTIVLANSYIYAHSRTRQRLIETLEATDLDIVDKETYELTKTAVNLVVSESKEQSKKAIQQIKAMRVAYPEVIRAVKTKLVALTVLYRKQKFVEQLKQGAIIEEKDYEALQRSLLIQSYYVQRNTRKRVTLQEPKDLMRKSHLFKSLTDEQFEAHVVPFAKHRLIPSGEALFEKGDNSLSFFVVIRGTTSSEVDPDRMNLVTEHNGSEVGVSEMLLGHPRIRTVRASSICEAYEIRAEVFAKLMAEFPEVETGAWQICGSTLAVYKEEPLVGGMSMQQAREFFCQGEVVIALHGEDVCIPGQTYLVQGTLEAACNMDQASKRHSAKYEGQKMLESGLEGLQVASTYAILLVLPDGWRPDSPQESLKDVDDFRQRAERQHDVDTKDILNHIAIQPPKLNHLSPNPAAQRASLTSAFVGRGSLALGRNSDNFLKRVSSSILKEQSSLQRGRNSLDSAHRNCMSRSEMPPTFGKAVSVAILPSQGSSTAMSGTSQQDSQDADETQRGLRAGRSVELLQRLSLQSNSIMARSDSSGGRLHPSIPEVSNEAQP